MLFENTLLSYQLKRTVNLSNITAQILRAERNLRENFYTYFQMNSYILIVTYITLIKKERLKVIVLDIFLSSKLILF